MSARGFFRSDSYSAYRCADAKYTIHPEEHTDLTDEGREFLERIQTAVNARAFKGVITNFILTPSPSGAIYHNRTSTYYNGQYDQLNSWENRTVRGKCGEKDIETSFVQFYGDDWAFTVSGSLYKLIK
jgi:hypothetical protein